MEEDIQNYSPTVMFRGTPCIIGVGGCTTGQALFQGRRSGLNKCCSIYIILLEVYII